MNFMKYDYYGNYGKNDDSYSFSIQEIHKKQKDKEKNRLKIYENIAAKCFAKIKETSANEETFCFFKIPIFYMNKNGASFIFNSRINIII